MMNKIFAVLAVVAALSFRCGASLNISEDHRDDFFDSMAKTMVESLELTQNQVEKFIPVYRKYLSEVYSFNHMHLNCPAEDMSGEEAMKIIKSRLDFNRNLLDAQEDALEELSKFMEPEQLFEFMKTETQIIEKIRKSARVRSCKVAKD